MALATILKVRFFCDWIREKAGILTISAYSKGTRDFLESTLAIKATTKKNTKIGTIAKKMM